MFAPTLWRHRGDRAFHQLQERLLHTFARDVTGDRRVLGLARDLVDFVDVNDTALRALHVIFGRLQKLQDDVLHVLANVTRFGESRRVRHCERHIQNAGKCLSQKRFTTTCRADQQYVRLCQFDLATLLGVIETLVVIVNSHRQHALGHGLPDHVIIKHSTDVFGRRNTVCRFETGRFGLFADDVHAQLDTFIADENGRPCNQLAHLMLAFSTKAAVESVLAIAARIRSHQKPFQSRLTRHRHGWRLKLVAA